MQLPRNYDSPFSLPNDALDNMPLDHPSLDSDIDAQEVYDEGIESSIDFDPYSFDDNPFTFSSRFVKNTFRQLKKYTLNHEKIKRWIKNRYGHPARIKEEQSNGARGGLYVYFEDDEPDIDIELISWKKFFKIFDKNKLAFVFKNKSSNSSTSYYYNFMSQKDVERLTDARRVT